MKTILTFKVVLTQPPGTSMSVVREYVQDAIISHAGGMDPKDPIFNLDRDSIRVLILERQVKY